jgi:hypothetical protein
VRISPNYVLPAQGTGSAVPNLAGTDRVLQRRFDVDLRKAGLK